LADQRNSGYLRIYWDHVPDVKARTINQASQLLRQERNEEALQLLQEVKDDPRGYNTMAVALYQTGHKTEALEYFRKAAANGNADARENLRKLGVK
jgi:Flp pilus assembly protein TadD